MTTTAQRLFFAASIILFAKTALAQTMTLRVTLQLSAASHLGQDILEFGKEVETRTGGAIKIQLFDGAQLYRDNQVVQAVGSGAIEMGMAPLGQFAVAAPAVAVFQQPFVFNFDALVRAAIKPGSEMRALIEEEVLEKTGTRVLWWQPYGAMVIFSKANPMTNPRAIADQDIRVSDRFNEEFIKLCGGKAQLISASDQYSAFEKGIVTGGLTGIVGVKERDLWRVTSAVTKTHHVPVLVFVVINEKVWQRLSSGHQRLLTELAEQAQERIWDQFAALEAAAY